VIGVRLGLYAGTFDPVTYGHMDILERSLTVFERVIVAVAEATPKHTLFGLEERVALVSEAVRGMDRVEVRSFSGLLVDFARETGAAAVIRGLRAVSDFEYEFQMALMNRRLNKEVETVFLMPSEEYTYLNSSVIREIASTGGDVSGFVPDAVAQALRKKYRR
jgi:pantetheine-phosphate adenylyltransferase